jgi:DNA-binding transcriptional LysR family regulator
MAEAGSRGEMAAFVRSVELGGFSAAARALKLTPSALSKLVSRLEIRLGVRLLNRTTRRLSLTAEGTLFFERSRGILADIEDAENEVMRTRDRPRGRLRLHVGVGFAMHHVVPALPRFYKRYPEVQVDLVIEDRNLDVIKDDIDISVRPGPATDTTLVVRKVFDFERIVCASPEYLARCGMPRSPDDLIRHACITQSGFSGRGQWPFATTSGRQIIDIVPSTRVNNADCALRFALMAMGIVRLNEFVVAEELRQGRLIRVLPDYHCTDSVPMIALYPHMRHRLPRVAAMLDFLDETFGHSPWRTATPGYKAAPKSRKARTPAHDRRPRLMQG